MKVLLSIIVLALIGYGVYYWYQHDGAMPYDVDDAAMENGMMDDDADDSDADTEMDAEMADDEMGMDESEPSANMMTPAAMNTESFDLVGTNYAYDVTEIRVKKGDTVTVNLTSGEGFHDWVVDEFDAKTDRVSEGESTTVTFTADTVGTFEYYCSVGNHRAQGMVGTLIVEE